MRLENNYYELKNMHTTDRCGTFRISLLPDCDVYRGHFPGNPVCPGVCNIQTIKECAERLTDNRLRIVSIQRCRLTAVATPSVCPELDVRVNLMPTGTGYAVSAIIADSRCVYMEFCGEMTSTRSLDTYIR